MAQYRRIAAVVEAHQVEESEEVGDDVASAGSWVVTDQEGGVHVVPGQTFAEQYEPVAEASTPEHEPVAGGELGPVPPMSLTDTTSAR